MGQLLGGLLVLLALWLGYGQHFGIFNYYGSATFKWLFWGLLATIGVLGLTIEFWFTYRSPAEKSATEKNTD